jgi:DNA replication protein DnaC
MRQRSVCILGGPSSGKSTYLGAMASAVRDGATSLFRMGTLPEDIRALARLEEPLLDGRYPQRTQSAETPVLRMNMEGALALAARAGRAVDR